MFCLVLDLLLRAGAMTGEDNRLIAGDNWSHNSITVRLIQWRHKTNHPLRLLSLSLHTAIEQGIMNRTAPFAVRIIMGTFTVMLSVQTHTFEG